MNACISILGNISYVMGARRSSWNLEISSPLSSKIMDGCARWANDSIDASSTLNLLH